MWLAGVLDPVAFGADPTCTIDSYPAFQNVVKALVNMTVGTMSDGIADLGGATIDLQGGCYLLSNTLQFPQMYANFHVTWGELRAASNFPVNGTMVQVRSRCFASRRAADRCMRTTRSDAAAMTSAGRRLPLHGFRTSQLQSERRWVLPLQANSGTYRSLRLWLSHDAKAPGCPLPPPTAGFHGVTFDGAHIAGTNLEIACTMGAVVDSSRCAAVVWPLLAAGCCCAALGLDIALLPRLLPLCCSVVLNFNTNGIVLTAGHETMISDTWIAAWPWSSRNRRFCTSNGINIAGEQQWWAGMRQMRALLRMCCSDAAPIPATPSPHLAVVRRQ